MASLAPFNTLFSVVSSQISSDFVVSQRNLHRNPEFSPSLFVFHLSKKTKLQCGPDSMNLSTIRSNSTQPFPPGQLFLQRTRNIESIKNVKTPKNVKRVKNVRLRVVRCQAKPWTSSESPYEILGLEKDATEEQVTSAFEKLMKEFDQDGANGITKPVEVETENSTENSRFVKIRAAYELLINSEDRQVYDAVNNGSSKTGGSDLQTLFRRFVQVASPYWSSEDKVQARLRLGAVFVLTLATTGISVGFNFLGRDFYNALASKDEEVFFRQLTYYLAAFLGGIPVFVLRDFSRDTLALRWRAWMTSHYMERYFKHRTFYSIQSQSLIDNPDQRIVDDLNAFTGTALGFSLALFNATIDLISFSGILYGIYPPLFGVLLVYSLGGTAISVAIGKNLVGLNFLQEKREADFRYGLVRVRENAESIAFYGGEASEIQLLLQRFKLSFQNYTQLLLNTRNLEFFTSGYRYLIQLLPAAVVAPLYFAGKIEFGVINQSFSAFNHVLSDFSIIVYQFQALSTFSAVIDRLGEFNDILDTAASEYSPKPKENDKETTELTEGNSSSLPPEISNPTLTLIDVTIPLSSLSSTNGSLLPSETNNWSLKSSIMDSKISEQVLLELQDVTLYTPQFSLALVGNLSLKVKQGEHLLIMGASGSGKTSLLRSIAGLWKCGSGTIVRHIPLPPSPLPPSSLPPSSSSNHATPETSSDQTVKSGEPKPSEIKPGGGEGEGEKNGVKEGVVVVEDSSNLSEGGSIFFVPQRPYMVLGSLRQQLLYPTWSEVVSPELSGELVKGFPITSSTLSAVTTSVTDNGSVPTNGSVTVNGSVTDNSSVSASPPPSNAPLPIRPPQPSDEELIDVIKRVRLGHLLERPEGLEAKVEWASVLSLGEQQRLAFARLLLSQPLLALMDESTSALDEDNEAHLYGEVKAAGVTFVSIGHRTSLKQFHENVLFLKPPGTTETGRTWTLVPSKPVSV